MTTRTEETKYNLVVQNWIYDVFYPIQKLYLSSCLWEMFLSSGNIWGVLSFFCSKCVYQFNLHPKIKNYILDRLICQRIDGDRISVHY